MKKNDGYNSHFDKNFKADATKGTDERAAKLAALRLEASTTLSAKQKAVVEAWIKSIK